MGVTATRTFADRSLAHHVFDALREHIGDFAVVTGDCRSDRWAVEWAEACGLPWEVLRADWETHGKPAGPMRNQQIVDKADRLIAFWDGRSRGAGGTIRLARQKGILVDIHRFDN